MSSSVAIDRARLHEQAPRKTRMLGHYEEEKVGIKI